MKRQCRRSGARPLAAATILALGAGFAVPALADIPAIDAPPMVARSVGTLDPDTSFSYTAETTDRAVAERVMDALATEPALEGAAITVLVDQGRVRLSGSTRDEDQASYAVEVAQDAAGPGVAVTGENLQPGAAAGPAD